MIETRVGDVLRVETGIIVHGCNCQGIMGGGIALQVKKLFPAAYNVYRERYDRYGLSLGDITYANVAPGKWVVNANTQDGIGTHVRQVSYDAVADCFDKVKSLADKIHEESGVAHPVVFPMIGAGLGGGSWKIIEAIIDETIPSRFKKVLYTLSSMR